MSKRKKILERIEFLKKEEKRYFNTYKTNYTPQAKVKHLREMADIIEELGRLEK
jgi:hypothetical protein